MRDAAMYNPSVASSEMTMFRKIEFVKSASAVRPVLEDFSLWIDVIRVS